MTNQEQAHSLDLERIRTRLATSRGPQFWRSLDELADTPQFRDYLEREFPRGAAEMTNSVSRRNFLKLMGASLVLAGATGCVFRPPSERLAPYAQAPANQTPGKPLFYATTLPFAGYGLGVIVKSNNGRPTKVEGNPEHPASLGATNVFAQAATLALCDPDRSQIVLNNGNLSTYEKFLELIAPALQVQGAVQGAGLRILTETITSPTMVAQLQAILQTFPQARWYQYDPVNNDNVYNGARLAFGEPVETRYRFDQAGVIVSLDADFLGAGPAQVRYARDFIRGRQVRDGIDEMSRLYLIEANPGITGQTADHRLPMRSSEIEAVARYIAQQAGVSGVAAPAAVPDQEWVAAMTRDLLNNRGRGLVIAGISQPPVVHALAHAINAALGNIGVTLEYSDPVVANPADQNAGLFELVSDMRAGRVEMLFIIGGNPAYDTPGELGFAEALQQVNLKVNLGLYEDETAALMNWHIPMSHPLELWSDLRAYDGTASIVQPLIEPLYDTISPHQLLDAINGQSGLGTGYEQVRAYWEQAGGAANFEQFWNEALHDGLIAGSAFPVRQLAVQSGFAGEAPAEPVQGIELIFQPDPHIWDGRYANNGWLQELPKPVTTMTWDNAALMAPATALALGLTNNDLIEIGVPGGRAVRAPVWIVPGHARESITLPLGYGRSRTGRVGEKLGFSAYLVRPLNTPWILGGATVARMGRTYPLAVVQDHFSMEGRDLVRVGTFEEFKADPKYIAREVYDEEYGSAVGEEGKPEYESLLPEFAYTGVAWGMTIDLTACIGCNACTIACQAENNIPVVGKEEVMRGREMHWIRIDRYFAGNNLDNPATYVQPVTCMHCEKAPCEIVCPVVATAHDHEGINNMIYNRCVGTKYCSNNCPYKVRRFNFFQYADTNTISLSISRNPDVTVRARGVMEKCTYCIQRISAARIEAKKRQVNTGAEYEIPDGTVLTACQQVCPTQAITFGNINDANAQVTRIKAEPHNYTLLGFLQTQPRTSYLARVRNLNPELEALEHQA